MDAKITLSFDSEVIERANALADDLGISLSRFTEIIFRRAIDQGPKSIEDMAISEWVMAVAEDAPVSITTKRKTRDQIKKEFFEKHQ